MMKSTLTLCFLLLVACGNAGDLVCLNDRCTIVELPCDAEQGTFLVAKWSDPLVDGNNDLKAEACFSDGDCRGADITRHGPDLVVFCGKLAEPPLPAFAIVRL